MSKPNYLCKVRNFLMFTIQFTAKKNEGAELVLKNGFIIKQTN